MTLPFLRQHTEHKIAAVIRQIGEIQSSDFPHEDSKEALAALKENLAGHLGTLQKLPPDADAALTKSVCARTSIQVQHVLPILGFVLRSTNVRNSFEFFDPLRNLACQLLGAGARLILSSEWEFSPMTYPLTVRELPNFVLIGLPASEAENALIIPLAGHELGHSVWQQNRLDEAFRAELQDRVRASYLENWTQYQAAFGRALDKKAIDDLEVYSHLAISLSSALRQCQEIFCDVIGVRLFGPSFLMAFEYLIAPFQGGFRNKGYPMMRERVSLMMSAAKFFGINYPENFLEVFENERQLADPRDKFLIDMADRASAEIFPKLLEFTKAFCNEKHTPMPDSARARNIETSFRIGVPSDGICSLADIIVAGWALYNDPKWNAAAKSHERFEALNEMVFKNIEVSEFCRLVNA